MTDSERLELETTTEQYAQMVSENNYLREKFNLLFRSVLRPGVNLSSVLQSFDLAFDISNAAGAQLDMIGLIVGVNRTLTKLPTTGSRDMDDEEMRTMIRMKIAQNTWDGTNKGATDTYNEIFGDSFLFTQVDNQDMTVSIVCDGEISTRQVEILTYTRNLLVPSGVSFTLTVNGEEIDISMESDAVVSGTLNSGFVTAD